jgi:hypothetical protein
MNAAKFLGGKLRLVDAPSVQQVINVTPESVVYDQNIFAIFEAESVRRMADVCARMLMRRVGSQVKPIVLISLRASIGQEDDVALLCGGQLAQLTDDSAVVLVKFVVEPSLDGERAHRIRSRELLFAASQRHAMANVSGFGRKEAGLAEVKAVEAGRVQTLVGASFSMPEQLMARFQSNAPLTFSMLLREMTEEQAAKPKQASLAAASEQPSPLLSLQQTWLHARNARLAELLAKDSLQIKCVFTGTLTKQILLENGSFINLPFAPSEQQLDKITWERATARVGARGKPPATWPYFFVTLPFLNAPPARVPVSVTESVCVTAATTSAEHVDASVRENAPALDVAEPEVRVPREAVYEPLPHFMQRASLAQLTMYEVETYARARLRWHVLRLSDYERAGEDDDAWFERMTNRERYPEQSGAMRSLLGALSAAAALREQHHETIGLGILALVAAPNDALREDLLFLEALAIEAGSHDDREAVDEAVFARLELLERFWSLCGPVVYAKSSASQLERVLAGIAADWQSGLPRMNN